MFRRPKHVKIMAQVDDKWSFQIEAPSMEAFACLSDWITLNTNSHNDVTDAPTSRTVGFSHTPAIDLGESEADTYRADDE
jgi:hypothetical protein